MKPQMIPQMEPGYNQAEAKALFQYIKDGGWGGEYIQTEKLEKMICKFTHSKYCSMTTNGTISLTLALLALGLNRGDEILVPNMTMIASPNSAIILGIKPILVDIEQGTLCMNLKEAEKLITSKTKALMYVSFNGRSGDMKDVVLFCKKHKLFLVEDSAQALGSFWQGKHLGTFGDIGSFSFSVPKIITTGQGGALITDNEKLYQKIEKIKDFGRIRGGIDIHDILGWNFKFSDFLAVVGIEQMKKLPKRIVRKKEIYQRYQNNLKGLKKLKFIPTNLTNTTPWFIDIYTDEPNKLADYLIKKGICTRKIYPAINTQPIFRSEYKKRKFPITQNIAGRGLWLPSSCKLTDKKINYITESIVNFFND